MLYRQHAGGVKFQRDVFAVAYKQNGLQFLLAFDVVGAGCIGMDGDVHIRCRVNKQSV